MANNLCKKYKNRIESIDSSIDTAIDAWLTIIFLQHITNHHIYTKWIFNSKTVLVDLVESENEWMFVDFYIYNIPRKLQHCFWQSILCSVGRLFGSLNWCVDLFLFFGFHFIWLKFRWCDVKNSRKHNDLKAWDTEIIEF